MQALLLATCLLLVAAMLGSLAWVAALREQPQVEAAADDTV